MGSGSSQPSTSSRPPPRLAPSQQTVNKQPASKPPARSGTSAQGGVAASTAAAKGNSAAGNNVTRQKVNTPHPKPVSEIVNFEGLSGSGLQDKVKDIWRATAGTVKGDQKTAGDIREERNGWKTVRIFVSSTFKDFYAEREVLVKQVFPELRMWCEQRKIHLIECDLRWGVPKDSTTEFTLRVCLGEIDRCFQDNIQPYVLVLVGDRIGWIPELDVIPASVRDEYSWVDGLSMTEMEIVHGAYRTHTPNALFMMRGQEVLQNIPEHYRHLLVEQGAVAQAKVAQLRDVIREKFDGDQVCDYECRYRPSEQKLSQPRLGGLDKLFSQRVKEFFQQRIADQYPLDATPLNAHDQAAHDHASFAAQRAQLVLGRDPIVKQINKYLGVRNSRGLPVVLVGAPGSGKSSITALVAHTAIKAQQKNRKLFYHFCGAVPGSSDVGELMRRLLVQFDIVQEAALPSRLELLANRIAAALSGDSVGKSLIILDAVNQLDDSRVAQLLSMVPAKLSPHVHLVLSLTPGSPQHVNMEGRSPAPDVIQVTPLDEATRQAIVTATLGRYSKQLDADQMKVVLGKSGSSNPLWLSMACEELRIFGEFKKLSAMISNMAQDLAGLQQQVLSRYQGDSSGPLIVATLCLLHVSATGLTETELREILGRFNDVLPPPIRQRFLRRISTAEATFVELQTSSYDGMLPAYMWAQIYRTLRPILRPFGDSGEGRIQFYHSSMREATRLKFLEGEENVRWFHGRLAQYFSSCSSIERKLEELPHHLSSLGEWGQLEEVLLDWPSLDTLIEDDFSPRFMRYWKQHPGGLERLEALLESRVEDLDAGAAEGDPTVFPARVANLAKLAAQCGFHEEALQLSSVVFDIEEAASSDLARRTEALELAAYCCDVGVTAIEDLDDPDLVLSNTASLTQLYLKAADCRRSLLKKGGADRTRSQLRLANSLIRQAHFFTVLGLESDPKTKAGWLTKAKTTLREAETLAKQVGDEQLLASAKAEQGLAEGAPTPEQLRLYESALELTRRVSTEKHPTGELLHWRMAEHHAARNNHVDAYTHFRQCYELCVELYGAEHHNAIQKQHRLRSDQYRTIAQERGDPVPPTPPPSRTASISSWA